MCRCSKYKCYDTNAYDTASNTGSKNVTISLIIVLFPAILSMRSAISGLSNRGLSADPRAVKKSAMHTTLGLHAVRWTTLRCDTRTHEWCRALDAAHKCHSKSFSMSTQLSSIDFSMAIFVPHLVLQSSQPHNSHSYLSPVKRYWVSQPAKSITVSQPWFHNGKNDGFLYILVW